MLAESYPWIRAGHIASAAASGGLFAARGIAGLLGSNWTMARSLRLLSYSIDTVLLACGLALVIVTHQYPLVAPWLTVKLVLLGAYIVLGSFALKRARTRRARLGCYVGALLIFSAIVSIALTRNPTGALSLLAPH